MPRILKRLAIGLGLVFAAALVAAAVFVGVLAFPGTPKSAPGLLFAGFVHLPKASTGALSVLDYLTIEGRDLYVSSESGGAVYRVPVSAGALPDESAIQTLRGQGAAHGVAFDPFTGLGFVSHSESNTVDVLDPRSFRVVRQIPVDGDVDGIFYDPGAQRIYAVNGDPQLATLIDPRTQTKVGTLPLGGKPEFAVFDPLTQHMFQNLEDKAAVAEVDVARRAVVGAWSLDGCAGPTSLALDQAQRRLYAVCSGNARFVALDLKTHGILAVLPVGGGPDSVAFDPARRRIYVTGKAGVMTVIQEDAAGAYRVRASVRLHYGAHTLIFDPPTGRLYVGYASLLTAPRLAVFDTMD